MADVFISYARVDRARVEPIVKALEAEGFSVWWDPQIAAGQEFDELISAELQKAGCVVVVWTERSVTSRWVRGEARDAADRNILIPIRYDGVQLPIDVRAIHTTDFDHWTGDPGDAAFQAVVDRVRSLLKVPRQSSPPQPPAAKPPPARNAAICVLPFENISGDPEQVYFSDGITEDIITDLSQIASLEVTSRNSAFGFKGRTVAIGEIARQLGVGYILEGSVRKAGNRVRISAQLIEAATDKHVWAERYDRDLDDIFAVQDDISRSIVAALKVRLAKSESKAIAQRGTRSPEAYRFYLMARRYWLGGWTRRLPVIVRLCEKALEIDPEYARAWALLAICLSDIRFTAATHSDRVQEAADRALELDPSLADAHAAKARALFARGDHEAAWSYHQRALELDPESYEVNVGAARWAIFMHKTDEGLAYLKTAAAADESDFWAPSMMLQIYNELGDKAGELATAREALARIERALKAEEDNSNALAFGVGTLVRLGDIERARDWAELVLILDPENLNALYNVACAMSVAGEVDTSLDILELATRLMGPEGLSWIHEDHDLVNIRDHPRFAAICEQAERRLGAGKS